MHARMIRTLGAAALLTALWMPSAQAQDDDPRVEVRSDAVIGEISPDYQAIAESPPAQTPESWEAECEAGNTRSCIKLADAYRTGDGVQQVRTLSEALYLDACDANVTEACTQVAKMYATGVIGKKGEKDATPLFERACNLGDLESCNRFSRALYEGIGIEADPRRAMQVAADACAQDAAESCRQYAGYLLKEQEDSEARQQGLALLDLYCRQESVQSCQDAANALQAESDRDEWQVGEYIYLACVAGSALECQNSARRTYLGVGVVPDRNLAHQIYRHGCALDQSFCLEAEAVETVNAHVASCNAGDMEACANAGQAFNMHESPIFDQARALPHLATACLAGVDSACSGAADLQLPMAKRGNPFADERALILLDRACDTGFMNQCYAMGELLADDDFSQTDHSRAASIFDQLCLDSYDDGCDAMAKLTGLVPEARLLEAGEKFTAPDDEAGSYTTVDAPPLPPRKATCVETRASFRGQEFVDTVCRPVVRMRRAKPTKPGEAPWQAMIWRPQFLDTDNDGDLEELLPAYRFMCGGSLIARGWILTAAHCVEDGDHQMESRGRRDSGYRVRLGVHKPRTNEGISHRILKIIKHKHYNRRTLANDVALIKFNPIGVKLGTTYEVLTIRLDPASKFAEGNPLYAYGWGSTTKARGISSTVLRGGTLKVFDQDECNRMAGYTAETLQDIAICAKGDQGEQICTGDSGGPLVHYDRGPRLVGIISSQNECGLTRDEEPGRFMRISKYAPWIRQRMAENP